MQAPDTIVELVLWLMGGLGLFLFGIDMMGKALRRAAGLALRRMFGFVTRTRWRGLLTGTVVTGLIQSSSASTVIIVGFISAGLLTFPQSVSLILGANLGTTITPQITAFKIDQYAIPMLAIGFILTFISRKQKLRQLGQAIMGFGMLFMGLVLMKLSVSEYTEWIRTWLEQFSGGGAAAYLGAFVAAAAATALIQSSSAMVVMIQLLFVQGALPGFEVVLPLILGAEVGTCITALLAGIRGSLSSRRAAVAHLLFNLIGALIATCLFAFYCWLIPQTSADPARQVANAHLVIRLINVILFLPFISQFGRLVEKIYPGEDRYSAAPEYLVTADLQSPENALSNIRREICRMAEISMGALTDAVNGFLKRDQVMLDSVLVREEMVDELCRAVTEYTMQLSRGPMPKRLHDKPLLWLHIMNDIERISDHAENIAELHESFPEKEAVLSPESIAELNALRELICLVGAQTLAVMAESMDADLPALMKTKEEINRQVDANLFRHASRIASGESTPVGGILYVEIVTNLRRVSNHLRNAAVSAGSGEPELTRIKRKLQETE